MKSIINGKRYDTTIATQIAFWKSGMDDGDLHYFDETIFKTARGTYFLHGRGGPLSKYRHALKGRPSGVAGGSQIVPLTDQEAITWLQEHGETHALRREFPGRFENDTPGDTTAAEKRRESQRTQSVVPSRSTNRAAQDAFPKIAS